MLYLTHFAKNTTTDHGFFKISHKAGSLSFVPVSNDLLKNKDIATYEASSLFRDFNPEQPGKVFTHLSEGIGDIIAFSAIAKYLEDQGRQIQIHVGERFFPVLQLFEASNWTARDFFAPVVEKFTFQNRLGILKNMQRIPLEYCITNGGQENWFEIYFSRVTTESVPLEYMRPRLDTSILLDQYEAFSGIHPTAVLLCPKASTQIRSSSLQDFHAPCAESMPHLEFSAFRRDLSVDEIQYARDKNITLLEGDFWDFIEWVSIYPLVVTTDTAALHLREGLQRPALGVYGAFTTDARTKYYKYTHSFNAVHDCGHQPCFKHQRKKDDRCEAYVPGIETAPCQSGEKFRDQLRREFVKYYLTLKKSK